MIQNEAIERDHSVAEKIGMTAPICGRTDRVFVIIYTPLYTCQSTQGPVPQTRAQIRSFPAFHFPTSKDATPMAEHCYQQKEKMLAMSTYRRPHFLRYVLRSDRKLSKRIRFCSASTRILSRSGKSRSPPLTRSTSKSESR